MEIPLKKHKLEEAAKDDGRKKNLNAKPGEEEEKIFFGI